MTSERRTTHPPNRKLRLQAIAPDEAELRLRFPPPYIEQAARPLAFIHQWQQLEYAFSLPDPNLFPALRLPLKDTDLQAITRYIESCKELATYSLLENNRGFSLNQAEGQESVRMQYTMPPKEILRGFAILFRQLHSNDPASYGVVRSIVASGLRHEGDPVNAAGLNYIRQWAKARAKLLQFTLMENFQMKVLQSESPSSPVPLPENSHTPSEIISMFQYGDYIHWGEKREQHAAILRDPVYAKLLEFKFHDVQIGLSHFYLGFSKLAEAAISQQK